MGVQSSGYPGGTARPLPEVDNHQGATSSIPWLAWALVLAASPIMIFKVSFRAGVQNIHVVALKCQPRTLGQCNGVVENDF